MTSAAQRNTAGPIAFRWVRNSSTKQMTKVGSRQLKCDVEGCTRSARWNGAALGWDIGTYCTGHKDEMLDVAHGILDGEGSVEPVMVDDWKVEHHTTADGQPMPIVMPADSAPEVAA